MTEMKCQNCEHEWEYTGEKGPGLPVTCPACSYKVWIPD